MGLDMYLSASKYLGNWEHSSKEETECFDAISKALGIEGAACNGSPSITVDITVAYWRKANAIHKWFVNNVQEGEDNCQKFYVSEEQLKDLVNTCKEVLKHKDKPTALKVAMAKLPCQGGFFFGSTEIDEYYWDELNDTINQIQNVLDNPKLNKFDFYYQASW